MVHQPSGGAQGQATDIEIQAREIIDEIPAAEMPTAIVFLEFLRERGAASLLGNGNATMTAPDRTSEELPSQGEHDDIREEEVAAS